jgi:hypothetical protein
VRATLMSVPDLAAEQLIERGLATRLLRVIEAERGKELFDAQAVTRMLAQCGAAIFACDAEERLARERFAFAGVARQVACVPAAPAAVEPIGALSGIDEYVLLHGTLDTRGNQLHAFRAAAAAGLPVVAVGVVEEPDYYHAILQRMEGAMVWLPEQDLTAGQLAAVYAGARVYADLGWAGFGPSRAVRAAGHGAVPVLSTAYPFAELWPEASGGADPASGESAAAVLRAAWMRAPSISGEIAQRTAQFSDPLRSLQGVLGAYAEASRVKAT